jgi:hypothetical protein
VEALPEWKQKLQAHIDAQAAQLKPTEKAKRAPVVAPASGPSVPAPAPAAAAATPAPAAKEPADELAERLAAMARRDRDLARREREARERLKAERTTHQADLDLAAKMRAASSTGKRLEILKAAGIDEQQIRGTWVVDLLNELRETDTDESPALTEFQARQLFVAEQKAREEAAAKTRQESAKAQEESNQAEYFAVLTSAFKSGNYPLTKAAAPSLREMDSVLKAHFAKTGVALQPSELLARFEEGYKARGLRVGDVTVSPIAPPAHVVSAQMLAGSSDRPAASGPEEKVDYEAARELAKAWLREKYAARK